MTSATEIRYKLAEATIDQADMNDLADWIRSLTFDELLACVEHSLSLTVRAFSGAMRSLQRPVPAALVERRAEIPMFQVTIYPVHQ